MTRLTLRLSVMDMLRPLWRRRRLIVASTLLAGLLALFWSGTRPLLFEASGVFKGHESRGSGLGARSRELAGLSSAILGGGSQDAMALMRSQKILKPVAEKLGLQGLCVPARGSPYGLKGRFLRNAKTEWLNMRRRVRLPVPDVPREIRTCNIRYDGELPLTLSLQVSADGSLRLNNRRRKIAITGALGQPIVTDSLSLTLNASSQPIPAGRYLLSLSPLSETLAHLQQEVKVQTDPQRPTILLLAYRHPDRHLAADVINTLMTTYQEYLVAKNERRASQQLAYLEEREREVVETLTQGMAENVSQLSSSVEEGRYFRLNDDLKVITRAQEGCRDRLRQIDLELRLLDNFADKPEAFCEASSHAGRMEPALRQLYSVRHERRTLRRSLERVIPAPIREEYFGISMDSAHSLHLSYVNTLENAELSAETLKSYRQRLENPDFDIGSLASGLGDTVTSQLIASASETFYLLHDNNYHSEKEHERLKTLLEQQRTFLAQHLDHQLLLKRGQLSLAMSKIRALQQVRLDLLDDQVVRLEQELHDRGLAVREALECEQRLLQQQLEDVRVHLHELPKQWMAEEQMRLRIEMGVNTVKSVADVVQWKNIANNLEVIDAETLDWAHKPTIPRAPRLILFSILGALLGFLASCSYVCCRAILQGTPAAIDSLSQAGSQVLGTFSGNYRSDRDVLRKARALLGKKQMLLALTDQGPAYGLPLANLLAREKRSVLLIRWSFNRDAESDEYPGLLQYLEGEVPRPRMPLQGDVTCVAAGGSSTHAFELLSSERWKAYLEQMKRRFEAIVIEAPLAPTSAEALRLCALSDAVVVTVTGQTIESLEPLIAKDHIAFITLPLGYP